jgi:predicted transposase/invertase (TIGR01784 family)
MAESKNEEIEKAKKELEKLAMNPEDRELYELRLKAIRDEMNIRYSGYIDGKADGMVEGEAKGKAAGKNERNIEIAQNMLKENVNIELISKVTGLSIDEIEKLK